MILAAASVMVVVFASFVLNDRRVVNLFGFGLATAIGMYALVAMLVLAPALLSIVGKAAWWPARRTRRSPDRGASPVRLNQNAPKPVLEPDLGDHVDGRDGPVRTRVDGGA